jgi:hypothetical protein
MLRYELEIKHMRIREIAAQPVVAPQKQEPLVLTPQQQAQAIAQAKRRKLQNIIAQRQAQERQAAANTVTQQDIETAFVAAGQRNGN